MHWLEVTESDSYQPASASEATSSIFDQQTPPLVRLDGMVVNVKVLRREVEEMGGPEKVSLSTLHRSLGLDKITVVKPADEEA